MRAFDRDVTSAEEQYRKSMRLVRRYIINHLYCSSEYIFAKHVGGDARETQRRVSEGEVMVEDGAAARCAAEGGGV